MSQQTGPLTSTSEYGSPVRVTKRVVPKAAKDGTLLPGSVEPVILNPKMRGGVIDYKSTAFALADELFIECEERRTERRNAESRLLNFEAVAKESNRLAKSYVVRLSETNTALRSWPLRFLLPRAVKGRI